jgi:hypothetical protein
MNKRPINIIEDDFDRVAGIELERDFISGEGELICCFHKQPSVLFGQFYHLLGVKKGKRGWETQILKLKMGLSKIKRPQLLQEVLK